MADQVVQDIKEKLNIVDIIGSYIQLKKSGTNYKAPCPFHNEKTASLMVSPVKQIWHCFGCGEGGDVFGFVMRYENLDFRETLRILADKAGVVLPKYNQDNAKVSEEKDLLFRINNFAAAFYHKILFTNQGENAFEYLKNRGLTEGTIKKWQIGFAPENFHLLEKALLTKKVLQKDMVKAGVSVQNENGQIYDRFRNRITFPIYNYFGEVVGFTARVLSSTDTSAKYINSPETLIYNKSQVLFGLNFAKEAIRKKDELVIVEGQMDCISLHQAGFENVIAASGTSYNESAAAFTSARRLTKNIKLCFDADTAGQNALRRTGEMLLALGCSVKVIVLKQVKDPDELVRKSPGLWEKAVKESLWFLDYYIEQAKIKYQNNSVEQKLYLSQQVVPFLSFIQDPLEQDHYVSKLANEFGITEKVIRDTIKRKGQEPQNDFGAKVSVVNSSNNSLLVEKEVLGGLLKYPNFANLAKSELLPEDFTIAEISLFIKGFLKNEETSSAFLSSILAKEATFMVEFELDLFENNEDILVKQLEKSLYTLKIFSIKRQHESLSFAIKQAEKGGDGEKVNQLKAQFVLLGEQLLSYEKRK